MAMSAHDAQQVANASASFRDHQASDRHERSTDFLGDFIKMQMKHMLLLMECGKASPHSLDEMKKDHAVFVERWEYSLYPERPSYLIQPLDFRGGDE